MKKQKTLCCRQQPIHSSKDIDLLLLHHLEKFIIIFLLLNLLSSDCSIQSLQTGRTSRGRISLALINDDLIPNQRHIDHNADNLEPHIIKDWTEKTSQFVKFGFNEFFRYIDFFDGESFGFIESIDAKSDGEVSGLLDL